MTDSTGGMDRIAQRRADRRKKQRRGWIIKGVFGVILLYLIVSLIFISRSGLSTTVALKGTLEELIVSDGYIFRDQYLLNAPAAGYLECRVNEGDRVNQGELLGCIFTGEYDPQRSQQIRELSDRISRLENSTAAENTYVSDTVMVEQRIGEAARDLSDLRQKRDMGILAERKEALNLLIERKKVMEAGGTLNTAEILENLKLQLQELEQSTGGAKLEIRAERPGVFSSRIDGLEDKLTLAAAETVTPGYLKSLDQETLLRSGAVNQGEPVCKVVDNYGWFYAASIPAEKAGGLSLDQTVRLRFSELSDTAVYGRIRALSPEEDGQVAVTVFTNRYVEGIYASSRASAEIITTSAEGIKLPTESLHVRDGQTGVYVLRLDAAHFVPVDVRYKNDQWAIVSAVLDTGDAYKLQIYDEVVVQAKNLEDGKVVR